MESHESILGLTGNQIHVAKSSGQMMTNIFIFMWRIIPNNFVQFSFSHVSHITHSLPQCLLLLSFHISLIIDSENILVISYEWMKANHHAAVETIAKFIGCDLTPSEVSSIVDQTTFDTMKANPATNMSWLESTYVATESSTPFLRKGKVGDWRNHFTDEQSARMDEEIKKTFDGTGLEFEYS